MRELTDSASRHVLLVEDNPGDADLIGELLAPSLGPPPPLSWVTTLQAAREPLQRSQADVVLLDLGLPDGAGVSCVQSVRRWAGDVPIVVLTGNDDPNLALACIDAGAQDYVSKREMDRESLRRAVDYAVARTRETNERQRADALQARLAAIVEVSSDAILSVSPDGTLVSWNRGAEAIFGYSRAEAVGRPFNEIVRPPPELVESEQQEQRLAQALAGDITSSGARDVVRCRKDGTTVTLSVVTALLHDDEGRVIGLAATARDISEQRRRDHELRQSNAELLARDRQMKALTARLNAIREEERTRVSREVHDELGQLLTGLKMDLRWVARRLTPGAPIDASTLTPRLTEAVRLVDATIAAVQRIALELRPSALDALGLSAAIRDEARRYELRTGLAVEIDVNSTTPPPPEASTGIFRIFQELLTNVARHAQASAVSICLDESAEGWTLRVSDDGVGFGTDDASPPTSLGLLGMRERADSLGGSIRLVSEPGSGTVATVSVPRS